MKILMRATPKDIGRRDVLVRFLTKLNRVALDLGTLEYQDQCVRKTLYGFLPLFCRQVLGEIDILTVE